MAMILIDKIIILLVRLDWFVPCVLSKDKNKNSITGNKNKHTSITSSIITVSNCVWVILSV